MQFVTERIPRRLPLLAEYCLRIGRRVAKFTKGALGG